MEYFDIFNGDADGICALQQLRLAKPRPEAHVITGVKRNIRLLENAALQNLDETAHLTVLDISLESNLKPLQKLLAAGHSIFYVDHHTATHCPTHPHLTTHIDLSATTCTSLIVDTLLEYKYTPWAICGAFGDNLHHIATQRAKKIGLHSKETTLLSEVGELLNYNSYGSTLNDLHFHPKDLYQAVAPYENPFDFFSNAPELALLRDGFNEDIQKVAEIKPYHSFGRCQIFWLPDTRWARRIAGHFANQQTRRRPDTAHAILTTNPDGSIRVNIRAPLEAPQNANTLCEMFGGGGRAAAAGINSLSETDVENFFSKFKKMYQ